jgi:metallo-beta-lactamase class B
MAEPQADAPRQAPSMSHPDDALTRRRFWQLGAATALTAGAASLLPASAAGASAATSRTAQEYFDRAAELAGDHPVLRSFVTALTAGNVPPRPPAPAPLRIFDNVAVVSVGWVSATAILTSRGIILIDALNTPAEAAQFIVPGLHPQPHTGPHARHRLTDIPRPLAGPPTHRHALGRNQPARSHHQ